MSRRKYCTMAELQAIVDNWSDDESDHPDERSSAIEDVICLPPDNTAGESDCETIDDDKISTNACSDENPFTEIAGILFILFLLFPIGSFVYVYRHN